jgi:hypothetical protein
MRGWSRRSTVVRRWRWSHEYRRKECSYNATSESIGATGLHRDLSKELCSSFIGFLGAMFASSMLQYLLVRILDILVLGNIGLYGLDEFVYIVLKAVLVSVLGGLRTIFGWCWTFVASRTIQWISSPVLVNALMYMARRRRSVKLAQSRMSRNVDDGETKGRKCIQVPLIICSNSRPDAGQLLGGRAANTKTC